MDLFQYAIDHCSDGVRVMMPPGPQVIVARTAHNTTRRGVGPRFASAERGAGVNARQPSSNGRRSKLTCARLNAHCDLTRAWKSLLGGLATQL